MASWTPQPQGQRQQHESEENKAHEQQHAPAHAAQAQPGQPGDLGFFIKADHRFVPVILDAVPPQAE